MAHYFKQAKQCPKCKGRYSGFDKCPYCNPGVFYKQ